MFSSFTSFLFGSSTSAATNCEQVQKLGITCGNKSKEYSEKNTIEKVNVPILIISREHQSTRTHSKSKRNNKRNKNNEKLSTKVKLPVIAKPSPTSSPETIQTLEGDSDENEWFFVEKEEENLSLIRTNNPTFTPVSKPLEYSQPEQENWLQKHNRKRLENYQNRNQSSNAQRINNCRWTASSKNVCNESIYAAPECRVSGRNPSGTNCESIGAGTKLFTMVDSWYLTPPPCFSLNGPIQLVITPFENLLIEHPSMSVYHCINSAVRTTEGVENFDLKENRSNQVQVQQQLERMPKNHQRKHKEKENLQILTLGERVISSTTPPASAEYANTQVVTEERANGPRLNRSTAAQLKMELFAWNSQKCAVFRDRQSLRRNAILRINEVREMEGRGNRPRRSDLQHCRLVSGVNNNRKCY